MSDSSGIVAEAEDGLGRDTWAEFLVCLKCYQSGGGSSSSSGVCRDGSGLLPFDEMRLNLEM